MSFHPTQHHIAKLHNFPLDFTSEISQHPTDIQSINFVVSHSTQTLAHSKLGRARNLEHLVTLQLNKGCRKTDSKFPEEGASCAVAGRIQSGEFHLVTLEPINKYSLLSAQTAKLCSSWRYN